MRAVEIWVWKQKKVQLNLWKTGRARSQGLVRHPKEQGLFHTGFSLYPIF